MVPASETITVRNKLEDLPTLYEALERFASAAVLSDKTRRSMMLIVEELFANTVNHGYPAATSDSITLSVCLEPDTVVLQLSDQAMPFDTAKVPEIDGSDNPLDRQAAGGLGLFLIHQLAVNVASCRDGARNITTVRLAHETL